KGLVQIEPGGRSDSRPRPSPRDRFQRLERTDFERKDPVADGRSFEAPGGGRFARESAGGPSECGRGGRYRLHVVVRRPPTKGSGGSNPRPGGACATGLDFLHESCRAAIAKAPTRVSGRGRGGPAPDARSRIRLWSWTEGPVPGSARADE